MTYRLKMHNASDIDGFINTLTANGYKVIFRQGGNARILMCDVTNGECVVRNNIEESCTTCVYTELGEMDEPCRSCTHNSYDGQNDNWEAKENERK